MTSDDVSWRTRLTSPPALLLIALSLAAVMALLPRAWLAPVRGHARMLLSPGQRAATGLRRQTQRMSEAIRAHFERAGCLAEARGELEKLWGENRRLRRELAAARAAASQPGRREEDDPQNWLLRARCVPARVLGLQARAFLARNHILDVGADDGVEPDALVVDGPVLIDRGSEAGLKSGQLAVRGTCVWGKIAEVGRHTSTVRAINAAGYRDLVQVAGRSGPQGILEGTGQRLARIRLVEVTEPVAVGDAVYTCAAKGVLSAPLLCGRIARLERSVGAAHWDIWMQPANDSDEPQRLAVLQTQFNPSRMAARQERLGRQ